MRSAILAIDQGTTNSKAILLSPSAEVIARGSAPVGISHPRPGWVEQDPDALWQSQLAAIAACLSAAGDVRVEAIGISNQRESVMAWGPAHGAAGGAARLVAVPPHRRGLRDTATRGSWARGHGPHRTAA